MAVLELLESFGIEKEIIIYLVWNAE